MTAYSLGGVSSTSAGSASVIGYREGAGKAGVSRQLISAGPSHEALSSLTERTTPSSSGAAFRDLASRALERLGVPGAERLVVEKGANAEAMVRCAVNLHVIKNCMDRDGASAQQGDAYTKVQGDLAKAVKGYLSSSSDARAKYYSTVHISGQPEAKGRAVADNINRQIDALVDRQPALFGFVGGMLFKDYLEKGLPEALSRESGLLLDPRSAEASARLGNGGQQFHAEVAAKCGRYEREGKHIGLAGYIVAVLEQLDGNKGRAAESRSRPANEQAMSTSSTSTPSITGVRDVIANANPVIHNHIHGFDKLTELLERVAVPHPAQASGIGGMVPPAPSAPPPSSDVPRSDSPAAPLDLVNRASVPQLVATETVVPLTRGLSTVDIRQASQVAPGTDSTDSPDGGNDGDNAFEAFPAKSVLYSADPSVDAQSRDGGEDNTFEAFPAQSVWYSADSSVDGRGRDEGGDNAFEAFPAQSVWYSADSSVDGRGRDEGGDNAFEAFPAQSVWYSEDSSVDGRGRDEGGDNAFEAFPAQSVWYSADSSVDGRGRDAGGDNAFEAFPMQSVWYSTGHDRSGQGRDPVVDLPLRAPEMSGTVTARPQPGGASADGRTAVAGSPTRATVPFLVPSGSGARSEVPALPVGRGSPAEAKVSPDGVEVRVGSNSRPEFIGLKLQDFPRLPDYLSTRSLGASSPMEDFYKGVARTVIGEGPKAERLRTFLREGGNPMTTQDKEIEEIFLQACRGKDTGAWSRFNREYGNKARSIDIKTMEGGVLREPLTLGDYTIGSSGSFYRNSSIN